MRAALATEAGVGGRKFDCKAFMRYVQSEDQCPELSYLRIITVTSKHVGADANDDLTFGIEASAASETVVSNRGLDWETIYDVGRRRPLWIFKIVEGESRSKAIPWLNKVRGYWARFIDDHNIARD